MTSRGTSNGNVAGNSRARRRRKEWLVETYRADRDLFRVTRQSGMVEVRDWTPDYAADATVAWEEVGATVERLPACRCYRCGELLTAETVTADRIHPSCRGGRYLQWIYVLGKRVGTNLRPACADCNSKTGGATRSAKKKKR